MKNDKFELFSSLEKHINNWKKENKISDSEDIAKVVENLLVYCVVLVAKFKDENFEIAGDIARGTGVESQTYLFDFSVRKEEKIIPSPEELN